MPSSRSQRRPPRRRWTPTATSALVGATLAAGAVAAWRQTGEAVRDARSGRRLTAATQVLPRRPDLPGAGLAGWDPQRPDTALGRGAAAAWAAPLTVVGAGLALVGGTTPSWEPMHGVWVARRVGGPWRRWMAGTGAGAATLGQVVLLTDARASRRLLAHEAAHARQAERLGPLFAVVYAWFGALHGYTDNPLERSARAAARRSTGR